MGSSRQEAVLLVILVGCATPGGEPDEMGYEPCRREEPPGEGRDVQPVQGVGDPPNIVVMVSDDQPYNMLGAAGNPVIRTPHLDSLLEDSVYFRNMYLTIGECSGSRATLWTGRLPHATGIMKNGQQIDLGQPILPRLLSDAGYHTAMIGKCHLEGDPFYEDPDGNGQDEPVNPDPFTQELGFEHRVLFFPDSGSIGDFYNYDLVRNGTPEEIRDEYVTDRLTQEALDYIEDQKDSPAPFFLWVAYNVPHEPLHERNRPPEFNEQRGGLAGYQPEELPLPPSIDDDLSGKPSQLVDSRPHQSFLDSDFATVRRYLRNGYEMVENLDTNVGRILAGLDQAGIAENTVFVFISDNGQFFGEHQMMRKGSTFYEEQMRTPLFVRFPAVIPKGRVVDDVTTSLDFMPTLLDLARVPVPERVMGASMVPVLSGADRPACESAFMQYEGWRSWIFPMRGVVWNGHKLVHHMAHGPYNDYGFELYDLEDDPYEIHNLAPLRSDGSSPLEDLANDPAHGAALHQLRRQMALWQSRTRDPAALEVYQAQIQVHQGTIRIVVDIELPSRMDIELRPADCSGCEPVLYAVDQAETLHAVELVDFDESGLWEVSVLVLGDNAHGQVIRQFVDLGS